MSSSYSREATAKFELDKAEKEIFENVKDFKDLFEFLKGTAKGGEIANNIYTLPYETNTKDLLQKYMKAKTNGEVSSANLTLSIVDWDLGSVFKKIYEEDKMFGGYGFNVYHAGNKDIIEDSDGKGSVIFDDTNLYLSLVS